MCVFFCVKNDEIFRFEVVAANLHMLVYIKIIGISSHFRDPRQRLVIERKHVKRRIWTFIRAIFAVSGKKYGILRMKSCVQSEVCLF